ncbi:MAG: hypothetical protein IPK26_31930 [Planctomycetes bacterium]|nr:hypothetical protein [Planctomycetota bacterium]
MRIDGDPAPWQIDGDLRRPGARLAISLHELRARFRPRRGRIGPMTTTSVQKIANIGTVRLATCRSR